MVDRIDIGLREKWSFLLFVAMYLVFRRGAIGSFDLGPIGSYGADFLYIPILMTSVKIVARLFNFPLAIGKKEVIIAVIYSSIVFEWLLPKASSRFVSDPFDIVAYFLGAIFYIVTVSRNSNKSIERKEPEPLIS